MSFAPYAWRAGPGYIPPPGSVPAPIVASQYWNVPGSAPPGQSAPYWNVPACPPPGRTTYNSPPLPAGYAHQVFYPNCGAVASAEPADRSQILPPAQPGVTVANGCTTWNGTTWTAPITQPAAGSQAPPALAPGVNYMFPPAHTMLHVFNKGAPIWEDKYKGQGLAFKIFKVSTQYTVKEVVERVMAASDDKDKCKDWACTEVVECGDGRWIKGTTIPYKDDKAKGNLASMGWSEKRGQGLPPVWLVVHKP
ncbi:hypothetical protein TI39_contig5829g00010 [Zymoseptoria brevis]|uniref:Uncharacterized protein n=1 Tax=Zymoseptoria brevis TaxID=1047168 RepID=A0A0F4G5Z2_9PEZI|nr:hypothetical protein TI39_contig5829g00010 [Zymoseptoria brevis]